MIISDIKIRKTFSEGNLKAIVSMSLENVIAIHDIKIIQGNDKLFVAFPNRKDDKDVFRDIVHPIGSEARGMFEKEILETYEKYLILEQLAVADQN